MIELIFNFMVYKICNFIVFFGIILLRMGKINSFLELENKCNIDDVKWFF